MAVLYPPPCPLPILVFSIKHCREGRGWKLIMFWYSILENCKFNQNYKCRFFWGHSVTKKASSLISLPPLLIKNVLRIIFVVILKVSSEEIKEVLFNQGFGSVLFTYCQNCAIIDIFDSDLFLPEINKMIV